MKTYLNSLALFAFLLAGPAQADKPAVETVRYVDLTRYVGTWYEIAAIPQKFQRACVSNVTAEYTIAEKGRIAIRNSCDTATGERKVVEGRAKVIDKISNAKLKVTFVKKFGWLFLLGGKYWIIDLSSDYSYAVVGHPSRDYAWILSRTPQMDAVSLEAAYRALMIQGFDTCKLVTTVQKGGRSDRRALCEALP
jgi:apolipoprotein D and lipocalin family protein